MALINPFYKKCLEQTSSCMYLCKRTIIKFSLDYCQYSRVCSNGKCHTPIPGSTRLADPNQVRGARPYTGTLYLFFFQSRTCTSGYGQHLITESKYHIHIY